MKWLHTLVRRWRGTPMVFQMEGTECGAACLGMVLGYHGHHEALETLRVACGVSRNGSVASRIITAARAYGLQGEGYNAPVDELEQFPIPSILFWDFSHFVVYTGKRGRWLHINDPGQGPCRFSKEEFESHYAGVVLTFSPGPQFTPTGRQRGVMATLLPLLLRVKASVVVLAWAGVLLVLPGLISPALSNIFVDEVLNVKQSWLYPLLLAGVGGLLAQVVLTIVTQAALRRGDILLTAQNTFDMLTHMFTLPMDFFNQRYAADLQHRVSLNSTIAQAVYHQLAPNCLHAFIAIFFLLLMAHINPLLATISVLTSALNVMALLGINRYRQVLCQSLMTLQMKLAHLSMTGISMMESLRACGREGTFFTEWSSVLAEYTNKNLTVQYTSCLLGLVPTLLYGLNAALILCLGADAVIKGEMTMGAMIAFQVLMGGFMLPLNTLVEDSAALQMIRGDVERVEDIFRYPAETRFAPPSSVVSQNLPAVAGRLELRDVTFGYGRFDPPTVRGISFTVEPGCRVALVGGSGSGKSTVARIASGLYTPWSGEVLLDNAPLESYSKERVQQNISMVDQTITLFSGSLADNLTLFDPNIDSAVLYTALRDVLLLEELGDRGGDTLQLSLQEMGANISGGQRQRLEIARALIQQSPVLILDEAMSALDPVTEQRVDAAIRHRGNTCLIVAHRLSTIRDCDEILFLEAGEIVERGDHHTLMNLNGAYARLMQALTTPLPTEESR